MNLKTHLAPRLWIKDCGPVPEPLIPFSSPFSVTPTLPIITYHHPFRQQASVKLPLLPTPLWWVLEFHLPHIPPPGFQTRQEYTKIPWTGMGPNDAPEEPSCGQSPGGRSWPGTLTDVQDAVPRPAPPPAVQLLLLHVLQAPVVENHTHYTLRPQGGAAHRSEGVPTSGVGKPRHPLPYLLLPTSRGIRTWTH